MQPVQVRMARAALELSIGQLADRAGLSHMEVQQVEAGLSMDGNAATRTEEVFRLAGVEFIGQDGVRYSGTPGLNATIPTDELNSANDE